MIHYAYSAVMVLVNLGPKPHFMPAGKLGLVNWLFHFHSEKRACYTLFAHAQFPQDFWGFESSVNLLRYTNLRKACRLLLYTRCLSLTTLCVDDDEGATKVLSSSLARIVHTFVHSS